MPQQLQSEKILARECRITNKIRAGEWFLEEFKQVREESAPAQGITDRKRRRPDIEHRRKPFQLMVPRPVKVVAEPDNDRGLTRKINR
jgi:hypothetical protein